MRSPFHIAVAMLAGTLSVVLLPAQANWRPLTPANNPGPRIGHGMAYDSGNDRVVLFGGSSGASLLNDTWLYDGNNWTQASPVTSPGPRLRHQLAYDIGRARTVLYGGGIGITGELGDTWEWNGSNWTQIFPTTQPPTRRSHSLIYYPPNGTVVMFGGNNATFLNDMWEYNGTDWSPITTANRPTARLGTQVAHDPVGGGIVLFSGYLTGPDTWYFDGVDWAQRLVAMPPPARFDHQMATDTLRQRIVLWGGTGVADTWEWDGLRWLNRQPATLPAARNLASTVYDLIRNRTIMYGGLASVVVPTDTWEYSTQAVGLYSTFGSGCVGSNNLVPRLVSNERPWVGETFHATVEQLVPGALTMVFGGFSNTSWAGGALPYGLAVHGLPGCQLLVDPLVGSFAANPNGEAIWSLVLPNITGLIGVRFFHQAMTFDAAATGGATVSNAGDGTIGAK